MQRERGKLTASHWLVVAALVLILGVLIWRSQQGLEDARSAGARDACELIHEETCLYDERFDEWVPRSEAR